MPLECRKLKKWIFLWFVLFKFLIALNSLFFQCYGPAGIFSYYIKLLDICRLLRLEHPGHAVRQSAHIPFQMQSNVERTCSMAPEAAQTNAADVLNAADDEASLCQWIFFFPTHIQRRRYSCLLSRRRSKTFTAPHGSISPTFSSRSDTGPAIMSGGW